jgi:hypothetical protein
MLGVHVVMRHQMDRGFATRLLLQGPVFVSMGEQNARGPFGLPFATGASACDNGQEIRTRSIWRLWLDAA